jgi:hypothetical protein
VDVADFFTARDYIILGDEAGQVTEGATRFLSEFGIDLLITAPRRRHLCRSCRDWTERRAHIGGGVGAALANRCLELGWTARVKDSRAVTVTPSGKQGFWGVFGIRPTDEP